MGRERKPEREHARPGQDVGERKDGGKDGRVTLDNSEAVFSSMINVGNLIWGRTVNIDAAK